MKIITDDKGLQQTIKKPEGAKIYKIIPKPITEKVAETATEQGPFFELKKQNTDKAASKPPLTTDLLSSRDMRLTAETIRSKMLKRPDGKINSRYIRKCVVGESISQKSSNNRYIFVESSASEIPISYRIHKDESLTPYTQSHLREGSKNCHLKNQFSKRMTASNSKARPMSFTFHNSKQPAPQYENRLMTAVKDSDRRVRDIRSNSRRAKIEQRQLVSPKKLTRIETVTAGMVPGPVSNPMLRKDLSDMTNLNYLISRGKVDKEYRMTSTILGSGSYAVVKLAERIDNADEKVAIKIYEKNKLYTNKHRRVNLCNEIIVLRSLEHKNIVKLINVYEDRANVYLILEYIKGMSLFKYIKDKKTQGLGDQETRLVFKEILNTLLY